VGPWGGILMGLLRGGGMGGMLRWCGGGLVWRWDGKVAMRGGGVCAGG